MVPRVVLPMLAVVVLLAAACTHKGTSDKVTVESKPYVTALVRDLVGHGVGDIEVSAAQARCLAPRWVNVLQPTRLEAAGIEPRALAADAGMDAKAAKVPLTDAEIGKLVDAFGDCDMDLKAAYIDHATAGATLSEEDRTCLTDALSDDLIRRITTVEVTKGAAAVDRDLTLSSDLFTALSACPGAIALSGG